MTYVPGFRHDVFVSYAHGDDRYWINLFVQRLKEAAKARLGVEADFWIDSEKLRRERDYSMEIPDSLKDSAIFLLLPSESYVRSRYCVDEEYRLYTEELSAKRLKFKSPEFRNELFAFRCPILPVDGNAHWKLVPGATDYTFCDLTWTLAQDSPAFQTEFRRLLDDLVDLLKRMRNHTTPVFLYPPNPTCEIAEAYAALNQELSTQSYRVLPETWVDLPGQMLQAALSVFLLGASEDHKATGLTEVALRQTAPWIVWRSPAAASSKDMGQRGFSKFLEQLEAPNKTFLSEKFTVPKLKEQVLAALRPEVHTTATFDGKRCVYVVFDSQVADELDNAGLIKFHYKDFCHFAFSDDSRQHSKWLSQSDGVLLVWGKSEENWCSHEFEEMQRIARNAKARGLCLFDPQQSKRYAVELIREKASDIVVAEQFGPTFDPRRLAPFFERLR